MRGTAMSRMLSVVRCFLQVGLIVGIGASLVVWAKAHDHEYPENNAWLRLLSSHRGSCCDGSDAVKISDPDWTYADGAKFIVINKGKEETIECRTNDTGYAGSIVNDHEYRTGKLLPGHICVRLPVYMDDYKARDIDKVQTAWFFVPDQALISAGGKSNANGQVLNEDGVTRVWPITSGMAGGRVVTIGIRCFLEGAGG